MFGKPSVVLPWFAHMAAMVCVLAAGAVHAQESLDACLSSLRARAPANGITVADFDRLTHGAQRLESTVTAARAQAGPQEPWWSYIAKTVDQERVDEGRRTLAEHRDDLERIGAQYQVEPEVLVAIFGIETNYGGYLGSTPVLDAWLTRACTEQRPLWVHNVYASLKLLRDEVVDPDTFTGSWSGAFGMTQFIPTSFYELAVDGDGDGRIDLYGSHADAFASSASHLRKRGVQWTQDVPAVIEVVLPTSLAARIPTAAAAEHVGRDDARSLSQWAAQGVTRADGAPLQGAARAYFFAPTGRSGPVFLATSNFDAILHYNQSRRYALSVSLLVHRIAGGDELRTPWPTDDPGLSRAQIRQLQELLTAGGHDIGAADGIPGARTLDAVRQELAKRGLPPPDYLGIKVLNHLREGT